MRFSTAGLHWGRSGWLPRLTVVLGIPLLTLGALNLAGCPQPTYQQMFPGVSRNKVLKITTDSTLTADEKTQKLKDLGITDDQVVFFLVNAPLSVTTQPTQ